MSSVPEAPCRAWRARVTLTAREMTRAEHATDIGIRRGKNCEKKKVRATRIVAIVQNCENKVYVLPSYRGMTLLAAYWRVA